MDVAPVALLQWPGDAAERDRLAKEGVPRVFLVPPGQAVPLLDDDLEDWIRTPADERDLYLRIRHLDEARRLRSEPSTVSEGVLRYGGATVILTARQARLMTLLYQRPWRLVRRDDLLATWDSEPDTPRVLDSAMGRLRSTLGPLGLSVTAIRGQGYVLHRTEHDAE